MLAIVATSESAQLAAELRSLLPELGIGEIRRRLTEGAPLVEVDPHTNDWRETHAQLAAIRATLAAHHASVELHETFPDMSDDPRFATPTEATRITPEKWDRLLENIARGVAEARAARHRAFSPDDDGDE
jgi:hypothetical protein